MKFQSQYLPKNFYARPMSATYLGVRNFRVPGDNSLAEIEVKSDSYIDRRSSSEFEEFSDRIFTFLISVIDCKRDIFVAKSNV